jgi:hypothetical protein
MVITFSMISPISDEFLKLIGLPDRIFFIGKGRKTFEFNRSGVNQSQLQEAIVGHEKIKKTSFLELISAFRVKGAMDESI